MKFKTGDLVRIKSALHDNVLCDPVAIILKSYVADPLVFKKNHDANSKWLAQESFRSPYVYDIIIQGVVETHVAEDWLVKA